MLLVPKSAGKSPYIPFSSIDRKRCEEIRRRSQVWTLKRGERPRDMLVGLLEGQLMRLVARAFNHLSSPAQSCPSGHKIVRPIKQEMPRDRRRERLRTMPYVNCNTRRSRKGNRGCGRTDCAGSAPTALYSPLAPAGRPPRPPSPLRSRPRCTSVARSEIEIETGTPRNFRVSQTQCAAAPHWRELLRRTRVRLGQLCCHPICLGVVLRNQFRECDWLACTDMVRAKLLRDRGT